MWVLALILASDVVRMPYSYCVVACAVVRLTSVLFACLPYDLAINYLKSGPEDKEPALSLTRTSNVRYLPSLPRPWPRGQHNAATRSWLDEH